ncbi:hypothetical protein Pan216_56080 [Planctomycetes bacterium Pan216]|uniref:Uncharacterized protein n=1 Tax=Kolteria novifilia TaxID=2527975 RepID=A0A518BCM9_9BACT|nr:hypothetical protein Pan216_56080 [Planctomycetes bacterium Pan216]
MPRKRGRGSSQSPWPLITFSVLTCLTAIFAVFAYTSYEAVDRYTQTAEAANKRKSQLDNEKRQFEQSYRELAERSFGSSAADDHSKLITQVDASLRSKLAEPRLSRMKNYANFSSGHEFLHDELRDADRRSMTLESQVASLNSELDTARRQYENDLTTVTDAVNEKQQELEQQVAGLDEIIKRKEQKIGEVTQEYGRRDDENRQEKRDRASYRRNQENEIKETISQIDSLQRDAVRLAAKKFEIEDGEIVELVDGGEGALINIGRQDGLREGVTFSIYDSLTGADYDKLPKGYFEVVRIDGARKAYGRLSKTSIGDPVVPGDLLFNPIWSPGGSQSVAYVGEILLDKDSQHDNEAFERLIKLNGGEIASKVDMLSGAVEGEIGPTTGWLVLGSIPEANTSEHVSDKDQKRAVLISAKSKMQAEARAAGVREIDYRNFLTYMGFDSPPLRVKSGDENLQFFGKPRERLAPKGASTTDY